MSRIIRGLTLSAVLLSVGCLPSLNAVYTEDDLVFEPDIVGLWQQDRSSATWDFSRRDATSYDLVYTNKSGETGHFVAHVAKVDDMLLLDLFPEKQDVNAAGFYKYHLVPFHTVYLVEQSSPTLTLVSLDLNWLHTYLTDNPGALQHATVKNRKLITAPTSELQQFLREHREQFTGRLKLVPSVDHVI